MKATQLLHNLGQSLWLDHITRDLLNSGTLQRYMDELSVTGLTSNPTIFEHALKNSGDYDAVIREELAKGRSGESLFFDLALDDLTRAADLFRPVHDRTNGVDGWASLEVSPRLAHDTASTIAAAKDLSARAGRPNLFIKIPGTKEGLPAIEEAVFAGVAVNVTGPLATSWHSNKFLNPVHDGAVLPILHLNGYKIAGPTVLARISHDELEALFRGHGYTPYLVEGDDPMKMHQLMAATLDRVTVNIRRIQRDARANGFKQRPRWPMIILRSPKGWTGPNMVDGKKTADSWRSHQVPMGDMSHPGHVRILEKWLKSYRPQELFDQTGNLRSDLADLAPKGARRMSANSHANGGLLLQNLHLPDFRNYAVKVSTPGGALGELRVICIRQTFASLVAESFDDIRYSAEGNVAVMFRMLDALQTIATLTASGRRRQVLQEQMECIAEMAERTIKSPHERSRFMKRLAPVRKALETTPRSTPERPTMP